MASVPALLVAGLALLLAAQAQPPSSMRPTPDIIGDRPTARKECPSNCSPNRAGSPRKHVCGNDGKTYPSACHLRRQQCQSPNSNLKLHYRGKCRPSKEAGQQGPSHGAGTPCQEARKFHVSKEPESKFVPKCDKDGNFLAMQCFKVYCWCVEPNTGNPILNTYSEHNKPDCSKAVRRKPPSLQAHQPVRNRPTSTPVLSLKPNRKPKKVCDGLDRLTFNKNLLKSVIVDMRHLPSADRTVDLDEIIMEKPIEPETQRRILELKFHSLDENHDEVLEKKEYRSLRKLARTTVTPRRCARTFIQRCDKNKDTKISKGEWLQCLGFDTQNSFIPLRLFKMLNSSTGALHHHSADEGSLQSLQLPPALNQSLPRAGLPHLGTIGPDAPPLTEDSSLSKEYISSEQDSSEGRGCLLERKTAMEQASGNNYVPQCTEDGKYQRAQCYSNTGYCFCVEEDTGKILNGSLVLKSDPQCNVRHSGGGAYRSPDKCSEEKKQLFIAEFKALMGAKVDLPIKKIGESAAEESKHDKIVAATFFHTLDKNRDRTLDKREWKDFRKIIDDRASLRQCGKKFLRSCDSNDDERVTPAEWELCLATPQSALFRAGTVPGATHNPNRVGKNPLAILLVE